MTKQKGTINDNLIIVFEHYSYKTKLKIREIDILLTRLYFIFKVTITCEVELKVLPA